MTTGKNCSPEGENFKYYSIEGCFDLENQKRMSPSSWDDSEDEDELTDTSSALDGSDLKQTRFYDASATNEALEEEDDRRQSSARVRRRKKDSTKSSHILPETHVLSATGNSFVAWNDCCHTDAVIFDAGIYFPGLDFSQACSKRPGCSDCESEIFNTKHYRRLTKIGVGNNVCNLNSNLSRIVEVDESKSNLSLGSTDNSHFEVATINGRRGSSFDANLTCAKGFGAGDKEIIPSRVKECEIVMSLEGDVEILTQNNNSSESDGIRSTLRRNFDDICCKAGEYFDNSLIYFFEAENPVARAGKTRRSNYEGDSLYFKGQISRDYLESTAKIEENELFQSFREVNKVGARNDAGGKISIDEVEDVSNCTDTTNESGTPKRHGNLTGRGKDHALSKESLDLGLENLFSPTRQTPSLEGMAALPEFSSGERIENDDSKSEMFFEILRKYPPDIECPFGNGTKVDEIDDGSIRGHDKSKSSFASRIALELDVSDKSSTTETKICGDSFSETESPVASESATNSGQSPSSIIHKLSETGKPSPTRSDTTDDAPASNPNRDSPSKCNEFGFGDVNITERNVVRDAGGRTDYPRDRGDMKFESYSLKSDWGRLIVQLDGRSRTNGSVKSIYRFDVRDNPRGNREESYRDENVKPVKSFVQLSKASATGTRGRCKITDAKKRKRADAFLDDGYVTGVTTNIDNNTNELKKNWLVNTLDTKRRVLRRRKGLLKTFLSVRRRGQNHRNLSYRHRVPASRFKEHITGGTNCFRTLYKQVINFFTVFCHKNRH